MKLIQLEQLLAKKEHIDLHQRAQKPKIRDADHRQPKRPLGPQTPQAIEDFAKRI